MGFRDAAIRDGARRLWLFENGSSVDVIASSLATLDAAAKLDGRPVRGRRNPRTALRSTGAGRAASAPAMGLALASFTFEALVAPKKDTSGLRGMLSTATDSFNNTGAHLSFATSASGLQPYWLVVRNNTTKLAITGRVLDASEYERLHHVVGTFDAATSTVRVYQQGAQTATGTYGSAPTDHPVTAIGRHGGEGSYYRGLLFALATYDFALSAAQVRAHWHAARRESALAVASIPSPLHSGRPSPGRR